MYRWRRDRDAAPAATPAFPRSGRNNRMYRFGIRTLIIGLAFAGGLLGLLAGGFVLLEFRRSEERTIREFLLETSQAISLAIDGELGRIQQELTVLSWLEPAEVAKFSAASSSTANLRDGHGGWVALLDPAGRQIFNARQTTPAASIEPAESELVHRVVETGRPAISNIFVSPLVSRSVAVVGVPVTRAGETKYVLTMTVPTEHFAEVFARVGLPADWIAALVDSHRAMVARLPAPLDQGDRTDASALAEATQEGEAASFEHVDVSGVPVNGAFTRSKLSGWSVGVGVPTALIEAPFWRSLIEFGAAACLLALAGLVATWRVGRRIAQSLSSLSRAADALGCREMPLKVAAGVREIEQTGAALHDAAELMKRQSVDQEKAMELLRRANEDLERKIRDRVGELAAADRQLSQEIAQRRDAEETLAQQPKMEAIGQLTAGIAHDFNNLLTAVIGNLELLRPKLSDERARRLARDAASAAERAALLTRQLLAFGRKQRLETRVIAINDLVAGAAPLIEQAAGPFVAVELSLDEDAGAVAVDPAQMELALLNLAINARDAMPGGGRLIVETRLLRVAGEHPDVAVGDWVLVSVADTGVGMSADVTARAFEPFFTTKQAGAGSGLGLSMVYGLVKQLRGEVALVSAPGHGTAVKIYLPRALDEEVQQSGEETEPKTPSSRARLLVVDDNPPVLNFMAGVLNEAGYDIVRAATGPQALDLFGDGHGFAAVVLDYAMPAMNGVAAAHAMLARRADTPILLVTGFVDTLTSREWPSEDILRKPFGPESLRQRVDGLVERSRGSR
jgi:signal transduction histidine kinase